MSKAHETQLKAKDLKAHETQPTTKDTKAHPETRTAKARTIVISALARVRELSNLELLDHAKAGHLRFVISRFDLWRYANDPCFRIDLVTPSMADSIIEELLEIEDHIAFLLADIQAESPDHPATISPILPNENQA